jgi:hypothetical protein
LGSYNDSAASSHRASKDHATNGKPRQTLPLRSEQDDAPSSAPPAQREIHAAQLVTAMLKANPHLSNLIFSPVRAPQIEVSGRLVELKFKEFEYLTSPDTNQIGRFPR